VRPASGGSVSMQGYRGGFRSKPKNQPTSE
jgi:hypothetical protein